MQTRGSRSLDVARLCYGRVRKTLAEHECRVTFERTAEIAPITA